MCSFKWLNWRLQCIEVSQEPIANCRETFPLSNQIQRWCWTPKLYTKVYCEPSLGLNNPNTSVECSVDGDIV